MQRKRQGRRGRTLEAVRNERQHIVKQRARCMKTQQDSTLQYSTWYTSVRRVLVQNGIDS